MKNLKFNFKSIVQSKARWLVTLLAILTLGVGQMWATTVYYVNRNSWSGVKIHYWGGDNGSDWGSRPSMSKLSYKVNGFDVYSYDIGNNTTLIFMDSSNDSNRDGGDVSFDDSTKPYYFAGWYASFAACWQLKSSHDSWAGTTCTSTGNNTGSVTVELDDDTEFKLYCLANSGWYGSGGGTIPDNTQWTLDGSSNTALAITHSGNYVFDIDFSGSSPKVTTHAPYQVSYDAGTGATGTVSASAVTTYGTKCTLSSSTFSKTGYTQDGWATSDGGSKAYDLGASYTGGYEDVTLYPHWVENTYTVTYTASDGGSVTTPATSSSTVGQVTGVSIVAEASSGYHFDGWSITSGTGSFANASNASTTFYPTANATIKATFAADAEETHDVSVTYKYGATTIRTGVTESAVGVSTARSVTAPSITGYTFSSWTLGDGLTNKSASTSANPISIVTKSTGSYTLQANYTINSYSVTFNAMSGSGSMSNESFNYNQTKALTTNAYTRAGYVFKGWATSSANATAGTVAYADGADYTMGSANVTLYAVWYKKAYFVNVPKWSSSYVKAHVYKDATSWKEWNNAAEVTTSTGTTIFGYTIYSYEFPDNFTTVIFHNNGENETDAWTWSSSTPYYYYDAGTQYASVDAIRQAWKVYGSWNTTGGGDWISNDFATYNADDATYTVSLAASTTYNFKYVFAGTNTWYGSGGGSMSDGDTWTLNGSSDVSFTSTVAGTYTFTIDYSGMSTNSAPDCTVDFPVSYTLTYAIGTVAGNNGSISCATASGSKVISGSTVILTAPAAATGYTWKGWYTNAAGTEGKIDDTNRAITVTMNADKTLYACYTEDMHDVTVNAETGGTVSYNGGAAGSSCTARAGIATASANIVATASTGYYFVGWQLPDGTITKASESTYNGATSTYTIRATADSKTVTALFNVRYALLGSPDPDNGTGNPEGGMPGWNEEHEAPFAYSDGTYTKTVTLTKPNANYKFRIVDRRGATHTSYGLATKSVIPADGKYYDVASTADDAQLATAGVGTYTLYVQTNGSGKPQVKIANPASHLITMGTTTFFNSGASSATATSSTAGGNVTAEDGEVTPNPIVNGNYIKDEGTITFTADPEDGYTFVGWYSNSACSSAITHNGTTIVVNDEDKTLTLSSIGAAKTVYAKFSEVMTTVNLSATNGKIQYWTGSAWADAPSSESVGVHTTCSLKVVPNPGYYFSGWTRSATPDFHLNGYEEANTNVTLTGDGTGTSGTLTANFKELEKIYFRNNFDDGTNPATHWENVYVYFDVDLQDSRAKTSTVNTTENLHVAMTDKEYKNIYWAYVPRYVTKNNKTKVAFANFDYAENGYKLWPGSGSSNHGQAVYREDFKGNNNMFVPYHDATSTSTDDAGGNTDYFNNGYWMYYTLTTGDSASYYVERRTGSGEYSGRLAAFQVLTEPWEDTKIQCRLRIDGISNDKYVIFNEAGKKYKASSAIAYDNYEDVAVVEDNATDAYFTLTPTSEGEYVITLDQSGDQMKISVNYPVAKNDYVIEHTYKGRNKANSADSTYTTRSNVIKAADAATLTRYSMYLNKNTATLKLRKCTDISDGAPVWSSGETYKLSDILTKLTSDGNGVYQFDIAVNTSTNQVSEVDSIRLYTGNFYIKTDAASGGWVAYKNNILDKNTVSFDRSKADTYDNYFCKYFESKECNIKSVIANDYCNQLSDTVKGDGIARMEGTEPFVPVNGTSIRFSYNSATNETKRAYMGASSAADFLNIEPNAASKIYKTDGTTDLFGTEASVRKFSDLGDWVYEMDLKVIPGGQAGVSAAYTDATPTKHVQTLINTDNTVLGGSGSTKYEIRVVYDFKTNYMMSSFILPSGAIEDKLSNVDMLWVRHKDHSPQQLILSGDGELKKVNVVAAIELRYDSVHSSGTGSGHVTMTSWTPLNRPFLKYFVSFPFDVPVNSIFGLNQADLGREYIIQHYNGAKRAKEGLFGGDDDNYWENLTKDSIMHANEGYCVIFDNDYVSGLYGHIWDNKSSGSSVYLYFPAKDTIAAITNDNKEINVKPLTCTIDRAWANNAGKNHTNTDSHWHMIGSPLFHDSQIKTNTEDANYPLSSYYYLDYSDNKWKSVGITKESTDFKAMSSVMVQWYGNVTWQVKPDPTPVPRRVSEALKNYQVKLDLSYNGNTPDWTYVQLREDADDDFVLREDMYKMYNSGIPQIYTFAGAYDVAYNGVPEKNQTIPVGVLIRKNGTYTFSMPTTFSGTVTLIDKFAQTRTDLAIDDYTVELEKGTIDDRFELEINIQNVVTSLENENGNNVLNDGGVHKFIKNDNMYILRNGIIYDAQGRKVK